jgi:hypothetical protein
MVRIVLVVTAAVLLLGDGGGGVVEQQSTPAGVGGETHTNFGLSELEGLALEVEMIEEMIRIKELALKRHAGPGPGDRRDRNTNAVLHRSHERARPSAAGSFTNAVPSPSPVDASVQAPDVDLGRFVREKMGLQPGATIIFTAATKGFIRGVVNWIALLHRLELTNVFIFAMDKETYDWFQARGLDVYPYLQNTAEYVSQRAPHGTASNSSNKYRRMQVWYERSRLIRDLLTLGYVVVQSDGDALWLQNPLFELTTLPADVDVAFSRGNARAGKGGRGTGVCMGFVMYRPKPGAISFIQALLDRMMQVYDVDQGIANAFIGGSRGRNRDTDKYNTSLFFGWYEDTRWVQLPQTRYARHAGLGLVTVAAHVDLHVFHPADEGWRLPFQFIPKILPANFSLRPANESEEVKTVCQSGRWFERMGYSERDQRILACCGLWMMKTGWDSDLRLPNEQFAAWLRRNSYIKLAQQFKLQSGKRAYHEPP